MSYIDYVHVCNTFLVSNSKNISKVKETQDKKLCNLHLKNIGKKLCNLKYSVPKKITIVSHNGSNYDYHFIIKELAEEFKKQFLCLAEGTEKYITFKVPIKKEIAGLIKMEMKLHKIYLTYYNLLIAQDLWRAHYQILSIIFLKESIELNVNKNIMIKNVKLAELNINIATVFLNIKTSKMV